MSMLFSDSMPRARLTAQYTHKYDVPAPVQTISSICFIFPWRKKFTSGRYLMVLCRVADVYNISSRSLSNQHLISYFIIICLHNGPGISATSVKQINTAGGCHTIPVDSPTEVTVNTKRLHAL